MLVRVLTTNVGTDVLTNVVDAVTITLEFVVPQSY